MLAFKFLSNMFAHEDARSFIYYAFDAVFDLIFLLFLNFI